MISYRFAGITADMAQARLEYAHVRNAEAGCFIARVERVFICD